MERTDRRRHEIGSPWSRSIDGDSRGFGVCHGRACRIAQSLRCAPAVKIHVLLLPPSIAAISGGAAGSFLKDGKRVSAFGLTRTTSKSDVIILLNRHPSAGFLFPAFRRRAGYSRGTLYRPLTLRRKHIEISGMPERQLISHNSERRERSDAIDSRLSSPRCCCSAARWRGRQSL